MSRKEERSPGATARRKAFARAMAQSEFGRFYVSERVAEELKEAAARRPKRRTKT